MKASLRWPVAIQSIVVAGFSFALERHRQSLNDELLRADREAAALQRPSMITGDTFPNDTFDGKFR